MRLDVGKVGISAAGFIDGADLLDVQEVIIEFDDLKRGARLVDGGFGESEQEARECPSEGDEDEGAFAAAQDAPVFDKAAGFELAVGV